MNWKSNNWLTNQLVQSLGMKKPWEVSESSLEPLTTLLAGPSETTYSSFDIPEGYDNISVQQQISANNHSPHESTSSNRKVTFDDHIQYIMIEPLDATEIQNSDVEYEYDFVNAEPRTLYVINEDETESITSCEDSDVPVNGYDLCDDRVEHESYMLIPSVRDVVAVMLLACSLGYVAYGYTVQNLPMKLQSMNKSTREWKYRFMILQRYRYYRMGRWLRITKNIMFHSLSYMYHSCVSPYIRDYARWYETTYGNMDRYQLILYALQSLMLYKCRTWCHILYCRVSSLLQKCLH